MIYSVTNYDMFGHKLAIKNLSILLKSSSKKGVIIKTHKNLYYVMMSTLVRESLFVWLVRCLYFCLFVWPIDVCLAYRCLFGI